MAETFAFNADTQQLMSLTINTDLMKNHSEFIGFPIELEAEKSKEKEMTHSEEDEEVTHGDEEKKKNEDKADGEQQTGKVHWADEWQGRTKGGRKMRWADELLSDGEDDRSTVASESVVPSPTAAANTSTTSSVSVEADDEWQRRHEKRKGIVLSIKTSSNYGYATMATLRDRGEIPEEPRTPNAYDRDISKRKWEDAIKKWKDFLREFNL